MCHLLVAQQLEIRGLDMGRITQASGVLALDSRLMDWSKPTFIEQIETEMPFKKRLSRSNDKRAEGTLGAPISTNAAVPNLAEFYQNLQVCPDRHEASDPVWQSKEVSEIFRLATDIIVSSFIKTIVTMLVERKVGVKQRLIPPEVWERELTQFGHLVGSDTVAGLAVWDYDVVQAFLKKEPKSGIFEEYNT